MQKRIQIGHQMHNTFSMLAQDMPSFTQATFPASLDDFLVSVQVTMMNEHVGYNDNCIALLPLEVSVKYC